MGQRCRFRNMCTTEHAYKTLRVHACGPVRPLHRLRNVFHSSHRAFFCDDGGFSTVGMVLAMLITLALLFSSAQVYKLYALSADIQNISDASALAAENQVASFYTAAQLCDAVVLSMNLAMYTSAGIGIVTACTPATSKISTELLKASKQLCNARKKFVQKATKGLNCYQKILPFIAAAEGYSVTRANSSDNGSYTGVALLVPQKADNIQIDEDSPLDQMIQNAQELSKDIQQQSQKAEEAAQKAQSSRHNAYMADCGNNPEYCMYERAYTVAGMPDDLNPCAQDEFSWSFSDALERSKNYYAFRVQHETPDNDSIDAHVDSEMRKVFYAYASKELETGYVHEGTSDNSFDAYFPDLPRNTSEMRKTSLYQDARYPITSSGQTSTMHAWSGCSKASSGVSGYGSISDLEHGSFTECPVCHFKASSLGKVAAASSHIENGYEYSYRIVAHEAKEYAKAYQEENEKTKSVKDSARSLFNALKDALKESSGKRIEVYPPGRYGALSLTTSTTSLSSSEYFANGFISGTGTVSPRIALSSATLAPDDPDEMNNVLTMTFDRMSDTHIFGDHASHLIQEIWSRSLTAWNGTEQSIDGFISDLSSKLPLEDVCGLGKWALNTYRTTIAHLGLEPAELATYKAVTVNSAHVLADDDEPWAQHIYNVKVTYESMGGSGVGNPLASGIDSLNAKALEKTEDLSKPFTIAEIEIEIGEGNGTTIPIEITLPSCVKEVSQTGINRVFDDIRNACGTLIEDTRWQ